MERKQHNIALCLGGGGVLGAYHIGVLKAIDELNIEINFISGTSVGSLIGALYCAGLSAKNIEKIALDTKWNDFYKVSLSQLGLLSNEKVGHFIQTHTNICTFKDLSIPFRVVTTNIVTGEKVVLKKGNLLKAIRASCSIPGIFIPVNIKNTMLVDGGIVDNVPISVAKEFGSNYIIAVDLNSKHSYKKPKNVIEVLLNSFEFLSKQATSIHLDTANLLLQPNLEEYNCINTDQIRRLIQKGYKESLATLKKASIDK
eukprot:gnl/Dysnectes_brevis/5085_a7163_362.p1 GENE.gnl/Dysnectes_brevis/5085_a7163_362~~gnl/Dysnectes_brevis/5085_a7163_362.p1  ORF type:complete len:257 (+),score=-54.34 gnl/Dysnectes_brevis/5085_a7163_362:52-822(+)